MTQADLYKANNWKVLCVLGAGLFISTLMLVFLQPDTPNLPAYEPSNTGPANYKAGGAQCSPEALSAIRDIGKRMAKRDDCAEKAEDYRLKADDLIQQTRSADAGRAQVVTGLYQSKLALFSTIGGFLTLIAAGLAAAYARDAARESKRSADAAQLTYDAFVTIEDASIDFSVKEVTTNEGFIEISYIISNLGRSTANLREMIIESTDTKRSISVFSNIINQTIFEGSYPIRIPIPETIAEIYGNIAYDTAMRKKVVYNFMVIVHPHRDLNWRCQVIPNAFKDEKGDPKIK